MSRHHRRWLPAGVLIAALLAGGTAIAAQDSRKPDPRSREEIEQLPPNRRERPTPLGADAHDHGPKHGEQRQGPPPYLNEAVLDGPGDTVCVKPGGTFKDKEGRVLFEVPQETPGIPGFTGVCTQ